MRLPSLKSREVVTALKAVGFTEVRQTGSHLTLMNSRSKKMVTVPNT
jgi:predicted RNA binding protein YcfA (HicA-like mRNA interferase family)